MIGKFLRNRNNPASVNVDLYNDMLSSVSWELGRRIDEQEKNSALGSFGLKPKPAH